MSTGQQLPPFPIVSWWLRRSRRAKRAVIALGWIALLIWLIVGIAQAVLDRWWFESVADTDVWWIQAGARLLLTSVAAAVSAAVLVGAALAAVRSSERESLRPNRLIVRYHERTGGLHRWIMIGLAAYLSVRMTVIAGDTWREWLMFVHARRTGVSVPAVGFDLSFHLFRLPFLEVLFAWLRNLMGLAFLLALIGHLAGGTLRMPRRKRGTVDVAFRQLAWIAVTFGVIQILSYLFVDWPGIATNRSGRFDGAGFTEVIVVRPSLWVLSAVGTVVVATAVWASRRNQRRLVLGSFGVWIGLHLVLTAAVPAAVDTLVVKPAEAERQLEYLAHNIDATREAYSLDAVEELTVPLSDGIASGQADDPVVDHMPILDGPQLAVPLQVLQGTTATRIRSVDLDRYEIDGVRRPVLLATRDVTWADLPERGWVQQHLVYTHGDGIVAVPADTVASDGQPDVDAFASSLQPDTPQLYFGEGLRDWYVIVDTRRQEQGGTRFSSSEGVALDSWIRRAVLATAQGEYEPLFSSELTDASRLLLRRDVRERLTALAPFLAFDGDPYLAVVEGHAVWIVDGYSTSSTYPYAQRAPTGGLPSSSDLSRGSVDYVKGSVKATVDAYDGSVHLYRTTGSLGRDPVLDLWERVYPGLLEPIAAMPVDLRRHLKYAPDLFTLQSALLGRYHVAEPETVFSGSDSWTVCPAAGQGVAQESPGPAPAVSQFMPEFADLGGDWVMIRPLCPGAASNPDAARDELVALAIADHDDPERLVLVHAQVSPGRQVASPMVAQTAIDTDPELARAFTLLNANGSAVKFGPMTPLLLGDGLAWVRSIMVAGTTATSVPRLYGVVAVSQGIVYQGQTAAEAVSEAGRSPAGQ